MSWKIEEVVDNAAREIERMTAELDRLMLDGKTVRVTGITNADLSVWYSRYKKRYNRLLRRQRADYGDPSKGYIVWLAEPEEPARQ